MIASGYFSPGQPDLFSPIIASLLQTDQYMLLADFTAYMRCQEERVCTLYQDQDDWTKKAILNVAGMGKFSSDRTIKQYAEEIWGVEPIRVSLSE